MLHCGGRRRRITVVLAVLAAGGFGCAEKAAKPQGEPTRSETPKPEEKPQTLPIAGTLRGGEVTLFDENGVLVAQVKARSGAVGQKSSQGGTAGLLYQSEATLHENGKPVATLTAEEVTADEKTHIVTGKGNVMARSLTEPGSPTVRADEMVWRPDKNEIRGSGNVLVTRENSLNLPGKAFVADTRIRRINMTAGDDPATLRF